MPDAIITSTASTFGTISGTFSADQSTIVGTVAGSVVGTLTGSVGVPGPVGPAGPGSTWGGIVGTLSDQTDLQSALDAKQNVSGMSAYLTKAGNLSGLTDLATSRDNLGLGSLSTPTFAGVNVPGSGTSVANLGATFLTINQQGSGQFTIQPSQGIVFPDSSVQTTAFTGAASTAWGSITGTLSSQTDLQTALNLKAPLAGPVFTGDARAVTAALGDNDTSIATTAFVQQELLSGTANARNLEVYVRNQTGSTLVAGTIVYINGATGNRPTITLAQANNDANSAQTFGFVKTAIANNGFGFVIVRGELENIDTSALTEGVQLYLSPTTAGTWTTTKPSAPQHLVYVGICVRAHPTQGVILVAVQNGYELEELHDVSIASVANNNLLAYESSTDLWKNKTFSALGLLTSADAASTYLTSATAASTYQTLAGMSSYLTTSAAASTYATKASPTFTGLSVFNNLGNYAISIDNSAGYYTSVSSGVYSIVDAAVEVIRLSAGGIKYPDGVTQSVAYPGASGFLLKADNLSGLANTGTARTNLGLGTMATATASDYSTTSVANGLYYPLSSNPASYLVAADIAGKAPLASPALTGNITITSNSTGAALFIEQAGTGNILTLHDQASDTTFVAIDQNGKVNTIASTTTNAGFNVPHGTAPTSPVNGDIWTTTSGLFMRQNGSTQQYVDFGGTQTISGSKTFSNANNTFGNSTAAGTTNIASGATISGSTKAVNLGTSGVAGSTTNITIGSTTGTSTTTLQGNTNGVTQSAGNSTTLLATTAFVTTADNLKANLASPTFTGTPLSTTAAADTNTTQIATTAFVVGQAGSATPLVDGTAAVGTSLRYARQDHVHPTDTTRAPLASPAFTGTPSLPTGTTAVTQTAGNNTTAVATTAFVTAAVPAFATLAEINSPSVTNKVVSPLDVVRMVTNHALFDTQASSPVFATSGAGAEAYKQSSDRQLGIGTPNVGVAGFGQVIYETTTAAWGVLGAKRGATMQTQNFNKRIWMAGTTCFLNMGDANTTGRLMLGGRSSATTGSPTKQSIGWRVNGGGGNPLVLVTYGWNGSALVVTETTSSFTPVANQTFDWMIQHEPNVANPATSFCYLYVNDTLVATGINSPADATVNANYYVQTCEATASQATRMNAFILPTKIWWSK